MDSKETEYKSKSGKIKIQSPSNIAIVKYWGKKDIQIPVNPSISFSLKNSVTKTTIDYQFNKDQSDFDFIFRFQNNRNKTFEEKIHQFFIRINSFFPWLTQFKLNINSDNTFPHSSGIASSASSFSALAISLSEIHQKITGEKIQSELVSEIARLGSGSACRSVYGGWNLWGQTEQSPNSSNKFAVNINNQIHPAFQNIQDSILLVSSDKKAISSTVGHQLMENHPYKQGRIQQANNNINTLIDTLKTGDLNSFIEITESEALSLHGLMMSSSPGYTLLLPNSLNIVQQIREFREQYNIPVCFTIDAGPNMHVLYPESNKKEVQEFIQTKLVRYCDNAQVIHDEIGEGPVAIS